MSHTLPANIVIRPSGVWNTRCPYQRFLLDSCAIQSDYSLLTLAVSKTRYDATHPVPTTDQSASRFLNVRGGAGLLSGKCWKTYRDCWRRQTGRHKDVPKVADLERSLAITFYVIRESTVVRLSASFELFAQCWALNMLLAMLENNSPFSGQQRRLLQKFWPLPPRFRYSPGVPGILLAFPAVQADLEALAHVTTDPETGNEVVTPMTPRLTGYRTIMFWRAFRNRYVHQAGRMSTAFVEQHGDFFEDLRKPYSDILRPLTPGTRLQLPSVVVPAMAAAHHRVARHMNEILVSRSHGKRGEFIQYDEPREHDEIPLDATVPLPQLLMHGDHAISLRWVTDSSFREPILLRFGQSGSVGTTSVTGTTGTS